MAYKLLTLILALFVWSGCADDDDELVCGPGTYQQWNACVPIPSEADSEPSPDDKCTASYEGVKACSTPECSISCGPGFYADCYESYFDGSDTCNCSKCW